MAKQDYYELLGVDRSSDAATVKRAFRKLAMRCHPDRNPGNTEAARKFKAINEAYDVLSNHQKRAAYDRFGHAAFDNGSGGGFDFATSFSEVFDDLFGDFMGSGRRSRTAARRGADLRYNLEISLEDVFSGTEASIKVATTAQCEPCEGSGAEPGTQPEACATCNGQGKIRSQQGFFMVERTCPACQGAGQVIASSCTACGGAGRVQKERALAVKVPPGVENGTRIRLSGEGEAGFRGGPAGDLYIFISITSHLIFERDGTTIFCRIPIPMTTAALGGEVEVATIAGQRQRIKIPEGTESGRRFQLRSHGLPQLNSGFRGDMIVEAQVETPKNLTKAQKELLRQFGTRKADNWSPEASSFLKRVVDFLRD
ncbi:MAG: molecular chaperone DnaJ [Proteobacteria bacterium]|nr:molecular chaperone DnaJ [Pseudomonadota bacterium]